MFYTQSSVVYIKIMGFVGEVKDSEWILTVNVFMPANVHLSDQILVHLINFLRLWTVEMQITCHKYTEA